MGYTPQKAQEVREKARHRTWSAAPALETRAVGWFKDRLNYGARLYSKKQKQQTKKKSGADQKAQQVKVLSTQV